MITIRTLTTDPETGEPITLQDLARRHGLSDTCVRERYRDGKRGKMLTESVTDTRRRAGREAHATRASSGKTAAKTPAPSAREMADDVLNTRAGRLASRLLRDYAA